MTTALLLAAFAVAIVMFFAVARRDQHSFEERFPPISDAEFLARCKPGTDPEVALKVRKMVAEYFAIEYERVHPGMTFVGDIGAD